MSVISTKREEAPKNTSSDLPKPYPANAPPRMHKEYYEERGIKVPKHINPDDVQGYVKHVTSAKKRGGTNLRKRKPTPSIMELPTVGKRN